MMPRDAVLRRAPILLLLTVLAACADTGGDSPPTASLEPEAPASAPVSCPANLSFVKSKLVTPYPKLEEFIGKDALDETFSKPVDDMIQASGGIDPAIAGGERYVQLYQEVLKNESFEREQYKKDGLDQEWIDTYFLSSQDGLTINEAFVEAVKCRRDQKPASTATQDQVSPPAG